MFKYLWIVVVSAFYLWWLFKAVQGLIDGIKFSKRTHHRFKFYFCPDETVWYIIVHIIAILAWSLTEFLFYICER